MQVVVSEQTAKALEKQGVKVVLAGRSHDKLNTVAKDMNEDNIHIVPTDVTNQVEVDALVAKPSMYLDTWISS